MRKYSRIYTDRGIDVVALLTKPAHVYKPISNGRATVSKIADALMSPDGGAGRPLLVHGFSAGGFLYGNLLCDLGQRGDEGVALVERIRGLVFDSPVDLNGVPFGLSRAVMNAEGTLPQRLIQGALEAYLSPNGPVRQYYQEASDAMHGSGFGGFSSPLPLPSLFLYSDADTVTRTADIQTVMREWTEAGASIDEVTFDGTKHVMHLQSFPDRYEEAVARLLGECGLLAGK
jgi:alpha-beta hydrolase superfamily lysophospholipase